MNLNEICLIKKIFNEEFSSEVLKDYIYVLSALQIRLQHLVDNKNLPSAIRISYKEDVDMLQSVINDLKKFS